MNTARRSLKSSQRSLGWKSIVLLWLVVPPHAGRGPEVYIEVRGVHERLPVGALRPALASRRPWAAARAVPAAREPARAPRPHRARRARPTAPVARAPEAIRCPG